MPLKKDLTVLTVSFHEKKRKEMKMLDQTNYCSYLFFLRDRFTHGYLLNIFMLPKQRTIKISLEWIQLFIIKLDLYRQNKAACQNSMHLLKLINQFLNYLSK